MIIYIHVLSWLVDIPDDISSPSYAKVRWFIVIWFSWNEILCGKRSNMTSKMVDYIDSPYELDEKHDVGNSSDLAEKLRSLKEWIRSCKEDNDRIIHAQEKKA